MSNRPSFYIEDAFAYVDTYNDLLPRNHMQIAQLKEEFETRYWAGSQNDPSFYAKLRAYEHALDYKDTNHEPEGMVIIGDTAINHATGLTPEEETIQRLEAEVKTFQQTITHLQGDLKTAEENKVELSDELHQSEQVINRLKRQMTNIQGAYSILFGFLILVAALAILL